MTKPEHEDHLIIDRLVLEYVESNTAAIDASPLVERILNENSLVTSDSVATPLPNSDCEKRVSRSWRQIASWWGTGAVVVAVAFLCGRNFDHQTATAATALYGVQANHAQSTDYCYGVRFDPDPRTWNPDHKLEGPSVSRLWTRGDRFWSDCAIGDIKFKLGREVNGSIWVTGSPKEGIRFSNHFENLPKTISQICQINSMSVPQLVNEVLIDFDLSSHVTFDTDGRKRTLVWAQLKPNHTHSLLRNAILEIDAQSNTLLRLVLWTVKDGQPRGTVTFTLLESETIDDSLYELNSHLAPEATIQTQTLPSPDYQPEF